VAPTTTTTYPCVRRRFKACGSSCQRTPRRCRALPQCCATPACVTRTHTTRPYARVHMPSIALSVCLHRPMALSRSHSMHHRPTPSLSHVHASLYRSSWLYLARRSERHGAPVLIWPVQRPTTKSAINVSSVSPLRWLTITPQPAACDSSALQTPTRTHSHSQGGAVRDRETERQRDRETERDTHTTRVPVRVGGGGRCLCVLACVLPCASLSLSLWRGQCAAYA
jgi:hypothetical protein